MHLITSAQSEKVSKMRAKSSFGVISKTPRKGSNLTSSLKVRPKLFSQIKRGFISFGLIKIYHPTLKLF